MADPALCGGVILELDSFRSPPAGLGGLSAASCSGIGLIILPKSTRRAGCSFIGHCYKQYSHHQKRIAPFVCYSLQLIPNKCCYSLTSYGQRDDAVKAPARSSIALISLLSTSWGCSCKMSNAVLPSKFL